MKEIEKDEIQKAVELLKGDDIVAIPTETVYGLAASIYSEPGLKKVFAVKERPFFDPLIVHVADQEMARSLTLEWTEVCSVLAEAFWPGPFTMVLKKNSKVSDLITAGLESVGLRCPKHPVALEVIKKLNAPLAAPSANKFKRTSPTKKEHVLDEFGADLLVLEGGQSDVGIESTVAGVFENRIEIYRPGMITAEQIQKVLAAKGLSLSVALVESPVAPGQLKHHYMPSIPIMLSWGSQSAKLEELGLDFQKSAEWTLEKNPEFVARQLYSFFRQAEREGKEFIHIIIDPDFRGRSEWSGVLNRLEKAKTREFF